MYRVVFPFELKLCNTSEGCDEADAVYNLFAVVVHIGSGMNHGMPSCCIAHGCSSCQVHVLHCLLKRATKVHAWSMHIYQSQGCHTSGLVMAT